MRSQTSSEIQTSVVVNELVTGVCGARASSLAYSGAEAGGTV